MSVSLGGKWFLRVLKETGPYQPGTMAIMHPEEETSCTQKHPGIDRGGGAAILAGRATTGRAHKPAELDKAYSHPFATKTNGGLIVRSRTAAQCLNAAVDF